MQSDVETLQKVDVTGWNMEKEQAREETLCRAKDDAMCCTQVCVTGQKKVIGAQWIVL
jgi:hypothetical protein